MSHIRTNDNIHFYKTTFANQCQHKWLFNKKCQGIEGHKGVHWCYSQSGSYEFDDNENDSTQNGCCGRIPPGNGGYVTPEESQKLYYLNSSVTEEITDPEDISRYQRGEIYEHETLDKPLTPEEISKMGLKDIFH